ncbi:MAG: alpha/beta fold hydrolase [Terracidiphilus sp.]|jgi:pimeloyl-ACP methyl ester carboxylesterase
MKAIKRFAYVVGVVAVAAGIGFWVRPVSYLAEATYAREFLTGVSSRSIAVAGYRMHYLVEGPADGPVVVLVHGLGGEAEDWRKLAPYLVRAGFRVYIPDLPGYGRSEWPAGFSYSIHDEAEAVVGFLDALELKQVDLGGWSMGGWIVQVVAARRPERVRRLMLFDSAGIYERPNWDTRLFTPESVGELDQLETLLTPNPTKIPGFVGRDIVRLSDEHAWVIRRAVASMLTGQDATDNLLPGLRMPVLIVWGKEDKITPLDQAEKIHQLVPQSQLEVFAGCGHLAPGQCTGQIGPKVVEFVKR